MKNINQQTIAKAFIYVVIITAVSLQLKIFLEGRDLFLDEINLVRNIVSLPFGQLFGGLDYDQHAPPLFLFLVKINTLLFGVNEYALRLVPLLAGILSVLIFYQLSKKFMDSWLVLFPLLLFALSLYLLEYSVSVKQYTMDILLAIVFVYWSLQIKRGDVKDIIGFTICGSLALWFSMPLIFILASIGIYLLANFLTKEEHALDIKIVLLMGAFWLLSFGILYIVNVAPSLQDEGLVDYHQQNFIPVPDSISDVTRFMQLMISVFRSIVGKTVLPIAFSILLFLVALNDFANHKDKSAILLVGPFILAIMASMLGYYAFTIRLTLFFLPGMIIMMGVGLSILMRYANSLPVAGRSATQIVLFVLAALCLHQRSALRYAFVPYQQEQSKKLIENLSKNRTGLEPIFVSHNAVPAFVFYTEMYDHSFRVDKENVFFAKWSTNYMEEVVKFKELDYRYVWFLDVHSFGTEKQRLDQQRLSLGAVEGEWHDVEADLYYINIEK